MSESRKSSINDQKRESKYSAMPATTTVAQDEDVEDEEEEIDSLFSEQEDRKQASL